MKRSSFLPARLARALARNAFGIGVAIGLIIAPAMSLAFQSQGPNQPDEPTTTNAVLMSPWVLTQLQVWEGVFGGVQEPNAMYEMDGPVEEPGERIGNNRYGLPFILSVKLVGEPTAFPNDPREPSMTFVVALMEGPNGSVPVTGVVISSNHPETGERIHAFLVAGMMDARSFAAIAFVSDHAIQGQPYRGEWNPAQLACVGACNRAAADATQSAMNDAAADLALASVALYSLLALCGAGALIPGVGLWAGAICGLRAYAAYTVTVAAIALALAFQLGVIADALILCLQGCGIVIAYI